MQTRTPRKVAIYPKPCPIEMLYKITRKCYLANLIAAYAMTLSVFMDCKLLYCICAPIVKISTDKAVGWSKKRVARSLCTSKGSSYTNRWPNGRSLCRCLVPWGAGRHWVSRTYDRPVVCRYRRIMHPINSFNRNFSGVDLAGIPEDVRADPEGLVGARKG